MSTVAGWLHHQTYNQMRQLANKSVAACLVEITFCFAAELKRCNKFVLVVMMAAANSIAEREFERGDMIRDIIITE